MFTSRDLKATIADVRPIIERQLDDATLIAGYREGVTAKGGDWSQIKALVKAMIQDERDESGGHKRVLAILHKADHALGYADMLGLGNLNEKNSFAEEIPPHDEDGVILADNSQPVSGMLDAGTRDGLAGPAFAGDDPQANIKPATHSEPASLTHHQETAEPGDRGAVPSSPAATVVPINRHDPETHFLNSKGLARLHGCQSPEACGSSSARTKLCFGCSTKHDGPAAQVAAE